MNSPKTNKFKVGDKIIRVDCDWSDMPLGSVWVVSAITNEAEIQVSGREGVDWLSNYFELVEDSVGKDNKEQSATEQVADNVNSPNHYASHSIECIVAMEAMLSPEEFIGYLRGKLIELTYKQGKEKSHV
jgi:hypothetical protein